MMKSYATHTTKLEAAHVDMLVMAMAQMIDDEERSDAARPWLLSEMRDLHRELTVTQEAIKGSHGRICYEIE